MDRIWDVVREMWEDPSQMMDQQRLERLEQCRVLQTIFQTCRQPPAKKSYFARNKNTNNSNPDNEEPLTLENTSGGIRMLRFFHWRELPENPATACQREEHALWACRAVAVGCGEPLTKLRDCFDAVGPREVLTQKDGGCYESSHQSSKGKQTIPCAEFQEAVGKCVAKNLHELQQRVAQRENGKASKDTTS